MRGSCSLSLSLCYIRRNSFSSNSGIYSLCDADAAGNYFIKLRSRGATIYYKRAERSYFVMLDRSIFFISRESRGASAPELLSAEDRTSARLIAAAR